MPRQIAVLAPPSQRRNRRRTTGAVPFDALLVVDRDTPGIAIRCLDQAIEVHGGAGLIREGALANMYEFVRLFKTVPMSREMILNHIAQHSLGLRARTS